MTDITTNIQAAVERPYVEDLTITMPTRCCSLEAVYRLAMSFVHARLQLHPMYATPSELSFVVCIDDIGAANVFSERLLAAVPQYVQTSALATSPEGWTRDVASGVVLELGSYDIIKNADVLIEIGEGIPAFKQMAARPQRCHIRVNYLEQATDE